MASFSKNKKGGPSEQVLWLRDRSKEWQAPAVVYEDSQFGTGYEPLGCSRMNVNVDCYWSTAVVSIHGEWTNYLPEEKVLLLFMFVAQQLLKQTNKQTKFILIYI